MAHSFITNRGRLLSDIVTGILPKSDAVDILVGYFETMCIRDLRVYADALGGSVYLLCYDTQVSYTRKW